MKSVCLLALPLSLITTGASGVTYGSPETFIGNFKIEAPIGSKLTVDYPNNFGAMELSAGQRVTADMVDYNKGNSLRSTATPNAVTFQTGVLNNDFTFNTTVVNAGTFKFPLDFRKNTVPTGKTVAFQPALLRTSFTDDSLSGKTAVLTFDVPSYNMDELKSITMIDPTLNAVGVRLSKNGNAGEQIKLRFKMLCAKHPTTSGTKGTSAACTSSEFKPYNSSAKQYSGIDKYKMSLLGSTGNYYHNTISFVPYQLISGGYYTPTAGTYTGNLTVTFGVEG